MTKARITKDSSRKLKDLLLEKEREGEGGAVGASLCLEKRWIPLEAEKGASSMADDDLHACICI